MMKRLFTDHPATVGESYTEHMGMACRFAGHMLLGGVACLVHALLPFLFVKTGSAIITELHCRMVTSRDGLAPAPTSDGDLAPQGSD